MIIMEGSDHSSSNTRWTHSETNVLISIWADKDIQDKIDGTIRDTETYRVIADKHKQYGYRRTPLQIKTKIKGLKKLYRKVRNLKLEQGNEFQVKFEFYELIDRVLGDKLSSKKEDSRFETIKIADVHTSVKEEPIIFESFEEELVAINEDDSEICKCTTHENKKVSKNTLVEMEEEHLLRVALLKKELIASNQKIKNERELHSKRKELIEIEKVAILKKYKR